MFDNYKIQKLEEFETFYHKISDLNKNFSNLNEKVDQFGEKCEYMEGYCNQAMKSYID